jgi:hypothetical protein
MGRLSVFSAQTLHTSTGLMLCYTTVACCDCLLRCEAVTGFVQRRPTSPNASLFAITLLVYIEQQTWGDRRDRSPSVAGRRDSDGEIRMS